MRIVVDTNVVVSGLLSDSTPPGLILEMVYSGDLGLVYDERIVAEYAAVLARHRFRLQASDIASFLDVVRLGDPVLALPLPLTVPDPSDLKFIEVAVAGGADAIVTGNARHVRVAEGALDMPVRSPRALLEFIRRG